MGVTLRESEFDLVRCLSCLKRFQSIEARNEHVRVDHKNLLVAVA